MHLQKENPFIIINILYCIKSLNASYLNSKLKFIGAIIFIAKLIKRPFNHDRKHLRSLLPEVAIIGVIRVLIQGNPKSLPTIRSQK